MIRSRYTDLDPESRKMVDALVEWGARKGKPPASMRNPRAFLTAYLWWGADLGDGDAGADFMLAYPSRAVQHQIRHTWDLCRRALRPLKQPVAALPRPYGGWEANVPEPVQRAAVSALLLSDLTPTGFSWLRWDDLREFEGAYAFRNPLAQPTGMVEALSDPIGLEHKIVLATLASWSGGAGPLIPVRPGSPIGVSEGMLRAWARVHAPGSFEPAPKPAPLDLGSV